LNYVTLPLPLRASMDGCSTGSSVCPSTDRILEKCLPEECGFWQRLHLRNRRCIRKRPLRQAR